MKGGQAHPGGIGTTNGDKRYWGSIGELRRGVDGRERQRKQPASAVRSLHVRSRKRDVGIREGAQHTPVSSAKALFAQWSQSDRWTSPICGYPGYNLSDPSLIRSCRVLPVLEEWSGGARAA